MRELIIRLEEAVLAGSGSDSFREIFKLLYVKLYTEKYQETSPIVSRNITPLFKKAKQEWPGVFHPYEAVLLPDSVLTHCLHILEQVHLLTTDLSVIDSAFEQLLPAVAKGNRGQYFTPRHIITSTVLMLNPQKYESVIDPAAGSGGFLLETIRQVGDKRFAAHNVYGIDFDERAYMVCKAMLLIAGHGDSHVYRLNSLERLETILDSLQRKHIAHGRFDIVLTNPPFGGAVQDAALLATYELAKDAKGNIRSTLERHILFLERTIQLLRPGGRSAIIVPQSILNNTQLSAVRNWLFQKARILGVVGLDTNTFKPYTNVKTSLLLLQKWKTLPLSDYPIFMAVSSMSGKNTSGNLVLQDGLLQSDLEAIVQSFRNFVEEQGLDF